MLLPQALTTLSVVGVVWAAGNCKTFKELRSYRLASYRCYKNCIKESNPFDVYGTELYHEDSQVCTAARHIGAIPDTGGTFDIIKHTDEFPETLYGTTRNRVLSRTKDTSGSTAVYEIRTTTASVTEEDMRGDVVMVHNAYASQNKRTLSLTCLSQDPSTRLTRDSMASWGYYRGGGIGDKVTRLEDHRLVLSTRANQHAFRCLGRTSATDVTAAVPYPDGSYQSRSPSVRFSKNQEVIIPLDRKPSSLPDSVFVRRLPDAWSPQADHTLPLSLGPATLNLSGIYIAHSDRGKRDSNGAFFDVIIRECEDGMYGVDCDRQCPNCQHGGQCHSQTGTCVCPPGYIGDTCQHACPPGSFGAECQLRCDEETLGFAITRDSDCRGVVICVPEPHGCSCSPGYTYSEGKDYPVCAGVCSQGKYGADCSETCTGCENDRCDRFTGACLNGCRAGVDCSQAPPQPQVTYTGHRRKLLITWNAGSGQDLLYFLTYQFLAHASCGSGVTPGPKTQMVTSSSSVRLRDLQPYAHYNVCVVTSNTEGHSPAACIDATTLPEAPGVHLQNFQCRPSGTDVTCSGSLSDTCQSYNGPDLTVISTLQTELTCNNSIHKVSRNLTGHPLQVHYSSLLAGQVYSASAQVVNGAGGGRFVNTTFAISPTRPAKVQNLTATVLANTAVQLLWNDPCPSNGAITNFYENSHVGYIPPEPCTTSQAFDRCHNITGLSSGEQYIFQVQAHNAAGWGSRESVTIRLEERMPGPPESITSTRESTQLDLTVHTPTDPGGRLINCTLTITSIPEPCTLTYTNGNSHNTCKFSKLQPGKKFLVRAHCCNTKFCGEVLEQPVATLPQPPQISGELGVVKKTNTTITLSLPTMVTHGDGESFKAVVVQKADQQIENLEAVAQKLLSDSRQQTSGREARRIQRRQAGPDGSCQQPVWIAGLVAQGITVFEIGDGGREDEDFYNCPLEYQHQYIIGIMAVMDLLGEMSYDWSALPEPVLAEPWSPTSTPWWLILLILLIIICLVVVVYFVYRRKPMLGASAIFRKDNSKQILDERNESPSENNTSPQAPPGLTIQLPSQAGNGTQHADNLHDPAFAENKIPSSLSQSTEELVVSESIYENIGPEEVCDNVTRRITLEDAEAYLNMTIKSQTAAEEFRSVPGTFNMPMNIGQLPANKNKNRYKNNLPYDDTRVMLSMINDDPNSDYINANHVTGYGDMRYIATQGPKNANVPTIADFWRMVIEQRVTAIIMVANFIEGGKSKVGEYFRAGMTLEFDGHSVSVINREQLPHFTVSSLQVIKDGYSRDVKHYQYFSWPDHGIPNEASSMALMVKHFLSNHSQAGCTAVHCSAGIGRTGTVLQVLLMCEMLKLEGGFDPLEVLRILRRCRARLVENQAQYNLSLEIFEEVLFGEKTIVSACDLSDSLEDCLENIVAQFGRVKTLPSPLTYKTASNPSFQSMNRDQSVLPADSRRIYLQMKFGEPNSQYINAVQIPGLNQPEALIVTEHPLPATLCKFWRLVVEKGCSLVILANNFEDKVEFPDVIPPVDGMWTLDDYTVHVQQAEKSYTGHLMHYIITISNSKTLKHRVELYQVVSWMYGEEVPHDPNVLVTLAELLLQNRGGIRVGPPLVSCGDGVTACGLVAAMTLLVERLQNEQCVDVYRTVVKLLRSRPQFITSETQFALLYRGASTYIKNFSTYGNFL